MGTHTMQDGAFTLALRITELQRRMAERDTLAQSAFQRIEDLEARVEDLERHAPHMPLGQVAGPFMSPPDERDEGTDGHQAASAGVSEPGTTRLAESVREAMKRDGQVGVKRGPWASCDEQARLFQQHGAKDKAATCTPPSRKGRWVHLAAFR